MEFSTLNESSLHKTLKILYATQTSGKTEVKINKYIYDVVTENNEVIEIQTKGLGQLLPKIKSTLESNTKITLVHPVIIRKKIITQKLNGTQTERKSSKIGSIYDILKELTSIYSILLNPLFTLEVLEVNICELREETKEDIQSKNRQRRYKKNWIKTGKKLENIINTKTFSSKEDYLSLLPENLPEEFSSREIKTLLQEDSNLPSSAIKNANLLLWFLNHLELITYTETRFRRKYYKLS